MSFHQHLTQRYAANRLPDEAGLVPRRPPLTTAAFRRRRIVRTIGSFVFEIVHAVVVAVGTIGLAWAFIWCFAP